MIKYSLIIIALSFLVYANSLNNAFVSDDIPAILENPQIGDIFASSNLAGASNALNYKIGKDNPFTYHLTNIILHTLNSLLVFFFLLLFFEPILSFWGALIFAVHPVHTEAVTWISGRPYSLSAVFLLSSLLLYARATTLPKFKVGSFLSSLVSYFLALQTCTFAIVFLAIPVLYDFTFARWKRNWRLWLAFFALAGLKLFFMLDAAKMRVAQLRFDIGSSSMTNPLFNAAFSIFANLGLLLWPKNLTLYHEPLVISPSVLRIKIFLLAILVLLLPLVFKKDKLLFFSIIFFIVFLLPTYSPAMISWLVAERYLYFPSIALSIWILLPLAKYSRGRKLNPAITALLIILTSAYSLRTITRNFDWKSHASIWRSTVEASPYSPKAHNNMGDVYSQEGNLEKAAEEFRRAIELKPGYAEACHNLANTYQKMGRIAEAILNYQRAISANPRLYQSYQNLGAIYLKQGREAQAKEYFQKALVLKPDNPMLKKVVEGLEKH